MGINLWDLELSNAFLDITPKAQNTKGKKTDNWDSSKFKTSPLQK